MEKMRIIGSRENEEDKEQQDQEMQCGCDVIGNVRERSKRKSVVGIGSSKIPFRLVHDDQDDDSTTKLKDGFHLRTDKLFLHYLVCFSLALLILLPSSVSAKLYTNQFAVHVPAGRERADQIATEHGFTNNGQVSIIITSEHLTLSTSHLLILLLAFGTIFVLLVEPRD